MKDLVLKKKAIRELIQEAGELQQKISQLNKQYKLKREELAGPLKAVYGTDKYVSSLDEQFRAILSYDDSTVVDVIGVIKKYNNGQISKGVIKEILSVRVGEAKKLLSDELKESLVKRERDEKPTLHIDRSNGDE